MGLFSSSKGKDSLRSLSEEDIQKKLYGNIKTVEPAAIKKTEKKRTPKPEEIAAPVPVYEHSSARKENYQDEEKETSLEESNVPTDDLFSRSYDDQDKEEASILEEAETEEESHVDEVPVESKEQVREQNIMARLAEIAEQEKRKDDELKAASSPRPSAIKAQNIEAVETKASVQTNGQTKQEKTLWLAKVTVFFKIVGKALLGFLSAVIIAVVNGCLKLLSIVDFRKSKVRRILYWVAGIICLVVLFGAIHLLNVKREAAMKTPGGARNSTSAKSVQKATSSNKPVVKKVPVDKNVISAGQTEVTKSADVAEKEDAEKVEQGSGENVVTNPSVEGDEPPVVGSGRYVIQVATYAGPKDAEKVVNGLRESNLKGFMKSLSRSSGKVYYSVFLGRYDDFQEAQEAFAVFKKNDASSPFSDAFIRTLNQ